MKKDIPGPVTIVKRHFNMPAFILNDEPFTKPVFETYAPETRYFKEFADAGCKVYSFSTNFGDGFGPPTWVGPDNWDFSEFDARAHRVLEADPDGLIIPRILLSTPGWWTESHPDELLVLDNGSKVYTKPIRSPITPTDRKFPSIASEKWRQDMASGLRHLIEHIQQSGYADNLFGYMITGLMTEEWYHWSSGVEQLGDYSQPYTHAFRRWLREKYGTVENLRKAWNNSSVDFDSAVIPSKAERFGNPAKIFRDPKTEMRVIDFYLFHNEIIPDTIDYFAKAVKDATGRTKVVGAFYGFMFEFNGDPDFGHNAMGKLIESPNIDFMMVTASYNNRQLGSGLDYARSPAKSVALHNKLWYHDNDTISFLYRKVMERVGIKNIEYEAGRLGGTKTLQESIWIYLRGSGFTLGGGFFQSLFDLHGGYFSDSQLLEGIKKIYTVFDESKQYDRSSCSEVLFVSDESSCSYVVQPRSYNGRDWWSELNLQTFLHSQPAFFKMGAPHDSILVDDLALVDMEQYKLIIFLNVYNLTDKQRELIKNKVTQKGKTVLWCYAPGLFNESKTTVEAMAELTGVKIIPSEDETLIAPKIKLTDGEHTLSREMKASGLTVMGTEVKSCKLFYIDDTEATVLGTLPATDVPTFAMKNMNGWTSIYTITPALPVAFYRAIARYAGVHIYNDKDDTLYVSKSYMTISVNEAGPRMIKFPYRCDVVDPFTGKKLYEDITQFTRDFQEKEVLLVQYL